MCCWTYLLLRLNCSQLPRWDGYMSRGKMEAGGGGMMLNCVVTLRQSEICPEDVLLSALERRVQWGSSAHSKPRFPASFLLECGCGIVHALYRYWEPVWVRNCARSLLILGACVGAELCTLSIDSGSPCGCKIVHYLYRFWEPVWVQNYAHSL